jgi:hypothetical protein
VVRNGFEAGNILYQGHWKGLALEIETFLGPEMDTSEAMSFRPKKVENFKAHPFQCPW